MEVLGMIVIAAILVESITTALKPIWNEEHRSVSYSALVSLMVGLLVSFAANLDLAAAIGIEISWPIVPQIITGIIISRGANYVYDILGKLKQTGTSSTSPASGGEPRE